MLLLQQDKYIHATAFGSLSHCTSLGEAPLLKWPTNSGAGIKVRIDLTGKKKKSDLLLRPLCEAVRGWPLEEQAPAVETPTKMAARKRKNKTRINVARLTQEPASPIACELVHNSILLPA